MAGQWFLLGKEVDHRFKIYFRANSSIDRVVYRLTLGMILMCLYFNFLSLIPQDLMKHFFWGTWVILGLFYSWPTRGKIIQETVSSNFNEFRFLDSFEKTTLGLCAVLFLISLPQLPSLENPDALKLIFDPLEKLGPTFWNFLTINYFPFKKFPYMMKMAWGLHFYFVGIGLYLLAFYGILRCFLSRRLSILGIFALLSSWSLSKQLQYDLGSSITNTYSILWVWGLMWATKSSTYRSGLFIGLLGVWGAILNLSYAFLLPTQLMLLYFLFLKDKTFWFKRQLLKYALFGIAITITLFILRHESFGNMQTIEYRKIFEEYSRILGRKAFYYLSFIGVFLVFFGLTWEKNKLVRILRFDKQKMYELLISYLILFAFSLVADSFLVRSFSIMWIIVFFSVIPLEWVFQSISKLRSKRNMIFAIYLLICLLDSHIEGRVKIFLQIFK